jgi:hypothetical protein
MAQVDAQKVIDGLRDDLRAALKARDRVAASALQSLLARIANAEAVPVDETPSDASLSGMTTGVGSTERPRRILSVADIQRIIHDEICEMKAALDDLAQYPDSQYAVELRGKIDVLMRVSGRN